MEEAYYAFSSSAQVDREIRNTLTFFRSFIDALKHFENHTHIYSIARVEVEPQSSDDKYIQSKSYVITDFISGRFDYDAGTYFLYQGKIHRRTGPAVVRRGVSEYWENGLKHRANAPAVIYDNGNEEWWFEGERHRDDGPAFILRGFLNIWYFRGSIHRDGGGPAIEYADVKIWAKFDNCCRGNGMFPIEIEEKPLIRGEVPSRYIRL